MLASTGHHKALTMPEGAIPTSTNVSQLSSLRSLLQGFRRSRMTVLLGRRLMRLMSGGAPPAKHSCFITGFSSPAVWVAAAL